MKKRFIVLFILFIFSLGQQTISAQQKHALVIGNGAYTNFGVLPNPVNDANDVATTLQNMGFNVEVVQNGSLSQMENAIIRLKNRLLEAGNNSYGFLYYAGHAVQLDAENYLIPADANIPGTNFLRERALSLQIMLDRLNETRNVLNIVVLDACRDFPASWSRSRSIERGLAVVHRHPANSIIMYATGAGRVASDGTGRNGLFTSHLLNNLNIHGLEVNEVFRRTMSDVASASNNEQRPALYTDFSGTAYLGTRPDQTNPNPSSSPIPRNVRAGTPGSDNVNITWDNAGSGLTYKIYFSTQNSPSTADVLGGNYTTTDTTQSIGNMASDTNYYFWVTSMRNGQESAMSTVVSVRTAARLVYNNQLERELANIKTRARGNYTITLTEDIQLTYTIYLSGFEGKTITIQGDSQRRTITRNFSGGNLFRIPTSVVLILGNNITLNGNKQSSYLSTNALLVLGTLEMLNGSLIRDCTDIGVFVTDNGIFNMRGGTIRGNSIGVYVNNAIFNMTGGIISDNRALSRNSAGGGVYIMAGTFNMTGGTVNSNIASSAN